MSKRQNQDHVFQSHMIRLPTFVAQGGDALEGYLHGHPMLQDITLAQKYRRVKWDLVNIKSDREEVFIKTKEGQKIVCRRNR